MLPGSSCPDTPKACWLEPRVSEYYKFPELNVLNPEESGLITQWGKVAEQNEIYDHDFKVCICFTPIVVYKSSTCIYDMKLYKIIWIF